MTTRLIVVRVTPARVEAAPTIAQTPGRTQRWPNSADASQLAKMARSGAYAYQYSMPSAKTRPMAAPTASEGMKTPAGRRRPKLSAVSYAVRQESRTARRARAVRSSCSRR